MTLPWDAKQILSFIKTKLEGYIKNELNKDTYIKNTVRDTVARFEVGEDGQEDNELLKTDLESFRRFKEVDNKVNEYDDFKDYIGGNIESMLSDFQAKVYRERQAAKTQQQIADELGCTQQQVSDAMRRITNKVKKKFLEFKAIKSLEGSKETYTTIKQFLDTFYNIIQYDTDDSFDYFNYTLNFLHKNYKNDSISFDELQSNKTDYTLNVLDVVDDYCTSNTYEVLDVCIYKNNNEIKFTTRRKNFFYRDVVRSFEKYITSVDKSISGFTQKLVNEKGIKTKCGIL